MTTDGEVEQMPVFEKYKPAKEGPDVPAKLKSKVQEGKWFHFDFKHCQVSSILCFAKGSDSRGYFG